MSDAFPDRPAPAPADAKPAKYALVVSSYNSELTSVLAENAAAELAAIAPGATIDRVDVPGAFEIPLAVDLVAVRRNHLAILALGVVLRGETAHAHLISEAITHELLRISIARGVPVIHEVLLLDSADQARERCLGSKMNRGVEAARAAVAAARAADIARGDPS